MTLPPLRVLGCVALVLFASGCATPTWDQYRGNARRTAFAPWPSSGKPEILWKRELGPMIDPSPVVGPDGTIYVAGPRGPDGPSDQLVAVNPDGTIKWTWQTIFDVYQLRATPAVRRDGSIVAVGHKIYADRVQRDPNGNVTSVSWKREARVFLVGPDGAGLARTDQNQFFDGPGLSSPAYDRADAVYHWHLYPLAGASLRRFDSSLAMTSVGGLSVTLEGYSPLTPWETAHCVALTFNAVAAAACWACTTGAWECWYDPEFPDAPSTDDPSRTPLDALTPSVALTQCNDAIAPAYESARFWLAGGRRWQKDIFAITTAVVGSGGRAYIPTRGSGEGRIEGRDQDGERRMLFLMPKEVVPIGPPALGRGVKDPGDNSVVECRMPDSDGAERVIQDPAADNLYVTGSDGTLYAIDYKGRLRWTKQPQYDGFSSPPVVLGLPDGTDLIVAASRLSLVALRGQDGAVMWEIILEPGGEFTPVLGSPAVHGDRIYVATQRELYAIGFRRAGRPGPLLPDRPR
jgi:hypothetical protein